MFNMLSFATIVRSPGFSRQRARQRVGPGKISTRVPIRKPCRLKPGLRTSAALRLLLGAIIAPICLLTSSPLRAEIRDGGIDPSNLGKGVWVYSMADATNKLGGHVASVTNIPSLMRYYKSQGLRYFIVKAATNDKLFGDCHPGPQFNSNLVNIAHANGLLVFGYNRSFGSNILGEVAIADYVFNQGADGFVFDAEAEWETGRPWITNGPAQAWQLCSTVRSNWPNKFLAHAPFPIIYLHASFPYKEFGFWCDAVMPQIYHFSSSGIKESPSAAINWSDVNWSYWQKSIYLLSPSNINGMTVYWTNSVKPIIPLQDVYGNVVPGGIICEGAASEVYSDEDVMEFIDYSAADPNAQTGGGYRGANFWRADTIGAGQWSKIRGGAIGNFPNVVNNIVMDDARATNVGAWNFVLTFNVTNRTAPGFVGATGSDTNSFGTNYYSKAQGSGAAYIQFTPNIVTPGNYDVYQWHPYVTNASSGTPFVITHAAGTATVYANQQTNSGNWSWLGRFNFLAGTSGNIRITDGFSDAGNLAIADGIKLAFVTDDLILDNTNAGVSYNGSWSTGTTAAGRYQADYRFASSAASETASATYRPNIVNAGLYDVFIWYPQGANRATNAPWLISFLGGTTNVPVNQQINGGSWLLIASALPFGSGTNGFVRLANNAGPSVVMADAVRFSFVSPLAAPTISLQPQDQTAKAGSNVTFTVTATGVPLPMYQWRFNDTNIPSATNSAFTRASAQTGDSGNYSVLVTNVAGGVLSSNAFLNVVPLAPLWFQSITPQLGGRMTLVITGEPGYPLWLERATNLADWQTLTNLLNTNGIAVFTDDLATNFNTGFYRARQ